jgi:hypothetical protein
MLQAFDTSHYPPETYRKRFLPDRTVICDRFHRDIPANRLVFHP